MSSVNVRRLVATMLGLGLAVAMTPAVAGAWCRLPGDYAAFWRSQAPDLRIPVYLGTGYRSSILYTGMPLEQVRAVVERMIAVHNEAVSVPTLYFAGTTEADLEEDGGMRARPVGIVVDSYICSGFGSTVPCTLDQLGCTSPGGNTPDQLGKARVTIQPQLCGKEGVFWGIEPGDGKDLMRVVLHEFGHALGLDHTNEAACTDDPEGPGTGVMSRIFGFSDVYERTWRRDDIAGLRAIYGGDISHSVYTWADDGFPQAPEETQREAVCEPMRTPPSLSSAASLVMAYTDAEDRVAVVVREEGRFVAPAGGAVVDPSEHGISFAPVGVANRDGDEAVVLVVWVADDARDARSSRLRWALRPLAGEAWKYGYLLTPTGETQTSARVAVGFDAETRRFVITSLTDDGRPYVVTMDTSGEQRATTVLESAQVPAVVAFEIGRASCGEGSVCKIGYRSSRYRPLWSEEILWAGWLEVEIGADDVVTLMGEQTVGAFDSQGMIDLAGRAGELRGVVGEQRYGFAGEAMAPVYELGRLAGEGWPLRIGSDDAGVRVAGRRADPACGNGSVDCAERCDDGNREDGDGCSASCELEAAGETGESPTGGFESGEAGGSSGGSSGGAGATEMGAGCGCGAGTGGGLLGVGLLGLRRRRRV